MIKFEWSEAKSRMNLVKHGVSFVEATTVFGDREAIQYFDAGHSELEDRFLMLGMSLRYRLLLVVHTADDDRGVVRIISARVATTSEAKNYLKR